MAASLGPCLEARGKACQALRWAPAMTEGGCDYVARYLERFLDRGSRSGIDLNQISDHAEACPACYSRLSEFFRTVELPESSFLRETLDELALALFNFARAVIRDRQQEAHDEATENVRITQEGGGTADENIAAGREMIDDAEDYAGSSSVAGMDLEEVRELLDRADSARDRRVDLAIGVFRRITTMNCRYTSEAWNWLGVLLYQKEEFQEAEAAFRMLLSSPSARAFAHCNLGWTVKQRGDVDAAVKYARKAVVLAEEDGSDPYFGLVAELYFRLLRGRGGDRQEAERVLDRLLALEGGRQRLRSDLGLQSNAGMLEALREAGLASRLEPPG